MEISQAGCGVLEAKSLWYRYKTEMWLRESAQEAVVHNIMRVLRSIRNFRRLAYVSVPITSGKFFYDLQLAEPDLPKKDLIKRVIDHNYHMGWSLVESLQQRLEFPVLYPADLVPVHQKWEQSHFQTLWLNIIAEMCTEIHLCEGWEFSNGGVEEFTHVMQLRLGLPRHPDLLFFNTKNDEAADRERMKNIAVYDHQGNLISLRTGIEMLVGSLAWLRDRNLWSEQLERCLDLLLWTESQI